MTNTSISARGSNGSVEWEVEGQETVKHCSESDLLKTVFKKDEKENVLREVKGRCELSISSSVSDGEG